MGTAVLIFGYICIYIDRAIANYIISLYMKTLYQWGLFCDELIFPFTVSCQYMSPESVCPGCSVITPDVDRASSLCFLVAWALLPISSLVTHQASPRAGDTPFSVPGDAQPDAEVTLRKHVVRSRMGMHTRCAKKGRMVYVTHEQVRGVGE